MDGGACVILYGGYFKKQVKMQQFDSHKDKSQVEELSDTGVEYRDLWKFDPSTSTWDTLKKSGTPPSSRSGFFGFGRASPRSSAAVRAPPSSARPPSPGRRVSPPTRPASHRNAPDSGMGTGLVLRSGGGGMRHAVLWPSATYFTGSSRGSAPAATGYKPAGMRGVGYSSQVRI